MPSKKKSKFQPVMKPTHRTPMYVPESISISLKRTKQGAKILYEERLRLYPKDRKRSERMVKDTVKIVRESLRGSSEFTIAQPTELRPGYWSLGLSFDGDVSNGVVGPIVELLLQSLEADGKNSAETILRTMTNYVRTMNSRNVRLIGPFHRTLKTDD